MAAASHSPFVFRQHMSRLESLNDQFRRMPPVSAMALRATAWDGDVLQLHAPLDATVKDKGSAFGGSLAGAMTLAGWGLLTLKLAEAGLTAEVYIADSQLRYLKPLKEDLVAEARLDARSDWDNALRVFNERGRVRVAVVARIDSGDGAVAAELEGRFALIRTG
jgi:thioesterase domain-containing protein